MVLDDSGGSHVAAVMDGEVPGPSRHLAITNPPNAYRHSMDEYYQREAMGASIIPSDAPPDYDALLDSPSLRRRFNIQPREDEGCEVLPPYSSAISLRAVFLRKMELEGAVHRAQNRNWTRVYVTLQGTALTFHKCKIPGILGTKGRTTPDFPAGTTKGLFLQSYNLQHADVGIAADYVKYGAPPSSAYIWFTNCMIGSVLLSVSVLKQTNSSSPATRSRPSYSGYNPSSQPLT
jgi:hypothetical protein